mgnify:CR=1 FL=1
MALIKQYHRELENTLFLVEKMADEFCATHPEEEDPAMRALLEDVSYNIMKIAVEKELSR